MMNDKRSVTLISVCSHRLIGYLALLLVGKLIPQCYEKMNKSSPCLSPVRRAHARAARRSKPTGPRNLRKSNV